jgi:hypothetical protein
MCPTALAPICPSGQQFCMDGTCQPSCDGIENACLCGGATGIPNYIPCAAGQLVNITHYDPHNTVTQSMQACASAASINSSSVGIWGDTTTPSNEVWLECPIVPDPTFTWTEPIWISVWTIMCFEAVLLGAWHLYKHFMEAVMWISFFLFGLTDVLRQTESTETFRPFIRASAVLSDKMAWPAMDKLLRFLALIMTMKSRRSVVTTQPRLKKALMKRINLMVKRLPKQTHPLLT